MKEVNPAELQTSIPLSEDVSRKFHDLGRKREHVSQTLQAAISAAVTAAHELGLDIETEQQALWAEIFAKHGLSDTTAYSVMAKSPAEAFIFEQNEYQEAMAKNSEQAFTDALGIMGAGSDVTGTAADITGDTPTAHTEHVDASNGVGDKAPANESEGQAPEGVDKSIN